MMYQPVITTASYYQPPPTIPYTSGTSASFASGINNSRNNTSNDDDLYTAAEIDPTYGWNRLEPPPSIRQIGTRVQGIDPVVREIITGGKQAVHKFHGRHDKLSPVEFVRRAEIRILPMCNNDQLRTATFLAMMEGDAAEWALLINPNARYRDVRNAFLSHFYSDNRQIVEFSEFLNCRYPDEPHQSADAYFLKWVRRLQYNSKTNLNMVLKMLTDRMPLKYRGILYEGICGRLNIEQVAGFMAEQETALLPPAQSTPVLLPQRPFNASIVRKPLPPTKPIPATTTSPNVRRSPAPAVRGGRPLRGRGGATKTPALRRTANPALQAHEGATPNTSDAAEAAPEAENSEYDQQYEEEYDYDDEQYDDFDTEEQPVTPKSPN